MIISMILRIKKELKEKLQLLAKEQNRSLNSQIVYLLTRSVEQLRIDKNN
jgi:predicted HicB family RNase H-like nuclease